MKLFKYIWILIVIYISASARTCVEDEDAAAFREEQSVIEMKDSIRNVFMSDSISDLLLKAYEITAREKLIDFADYLKIAADTTLDPEFRQHSFEMAGSLFITKEPIITAWYKGYSMNTENTGETKRYVLTSLNTDFWAMPEKIEISNALIRENDSTYSGRLSFYQKWLPFFDSLSPADISGPLTIDFYLIKTRKSFSGQQLKVWDVFLASIK
ncbi:MAG: hypothetical protein V1903_06240 [Bacteroidota bacterium]